MTEHGDNLIITNFNNRTIVDENSNFVSVVLWGCPVCFLRTSPAHVKSSTPDIPEGPPFLRSPPRSSYDQTGREPTTLVIG